MDADVVDYELPVELVTLLLPTVASFVITACAAYGSERAKHLFLVLGLTRCVTG